MKLLYLLILFLPNLVFSQSLFQESAIAPALKNKAGAVVRDSETVIEIKSVDQVILRKKNIITILNKSGESEAQIVVYYNKTRKIKSIKGVIYNEVGRQVKKFSEKDFSDVSAVSNGSLYGDSRLKILKAGLLTYPYTIEYEYEIKVNQSLYYPSWYPLYSKGTSVEKSSMTVIHPSTFKMRFKEVNFKGTKEESHEALTTIKWSVNNIEAIKDEPFSPEHESILTIVKMSPEKFSYHGVSGNFSNWNEYGKWVNESLLFGRQELPLSTVQKIKDLTDPIDDPKEKAKIIYEYMQKKTRYISVQIGIGGIQPYPASDVDKLGYGDCKGLSNYTKALLSVAGIESYYSVVNAGRFKEDISGDFASISDGNHIILCLPFPNDTTWLECTSQQMPFGFLSDFTDDRVVVACTPDGGRLLRTAKYDYEVNKQIRKGNFSINDKGDLTGSLQTNFEGTQYDNHEILFGEPFSEQVKLIGKMYPFPNLKIEKLEYSQNKNKMPLSVETVSLISTGYGAVSTSGMLVSLNPINKNGFVPKEVRNRINPLYINRGYSDYDEYTFKLPEGYKIDSFNKDVLLEKAFGSYSMKILVEDHHITYKRTLIFKEGTYPVDQYQELVNFYKKVNEGDQSKVMLLKATL